MSTIKFDKQDELNELIARIYLDTNKKFTKKDLLEIIFELGTEDYHALTEKIKNRDSSTSKDLRTQFINRFSGSISVSKPNDVNPKNIWEEKLEE
ncbi:MAG: hypothetical protein BAJALOKI2v1_1090008 [Promethearchaeota archaeon]|nr:MAG: hypothetical protein BAJALOKI2v1_1090008 [Candidatus Lokiarchaeota archaeon]